MDRTLRSTVIAAALILSLGSCAAPEPSPTASPTPEPTAAPADEALAPAPVLDLECEDLLDAASADALLAQPATAAGSPALSGLPSWAGSAYDYALQQLGGLSCVRGNGEASRTAAGRNPAWSGIELKVLPEASEGWQLFAANYSPDSPSEALVSCQPDGPSLSCGVDALVGTTWVQIVAAGLPADGEEGIRSLLATVSTSVSQAAVLESSWSPPADGIPVSGDCQSLLTAEQVATVGGEPTSGAEHPGGGWSLDATSWVMLDAMPCSFGAPSTEPSGLPAIDWLPGGEWAWNDRAPAGDPVEVSGRGTDAAVVSCSDEICTLDLLAASNWVQVSQSMIDADADAARADLGAYAQLIIDNVRG